MKFIDFINNLNVEERKNFEHYSSIRGIQVYRIIYECLAKNGDSITYSDVNAFVKYDKAIKDVLYKYLGTLEEFIKNFIFINYDFVNNEELTKDFYIYFKDLPVVEKRDVNSFEITELYKRFSLMFGEIIKFLKEYEVNQLDVEKLEKVRKLRNNVMHHSPLLFDCNFASIKDATEEQIDCLIKSLPKQYHIGITNELAEKTNATRRNINSTFYKYLLFREE
ncbi:MAG: hypothetical protein K2O05_01800 [Anaeroplasmataceae bacterium]|nr:hypothetical protein [Anaeroplasmataceae bacterium]